MNDDYNKAATEVLEIIKHLESKMKNRISRENMEKLESLKDMNYKFELNINIPFYENTFMPESLELLRNVLDIS